MFIFSNSYQHWLNYSKTETEYNPVWDTFMLLTTSLQWKNPIWWVMQRLTVHRYKYPNLFDQNICMREKAICLWYRRWISLTPRNWGMRIRWWWLMQTILQVNQEQWKLFFLQMCVWTLWQISSFFFHSIKSCIFLYQNEK